MVDVAAQRYPVLPVRSLMRNRYDSVAKLTAYHGSLIQLHGRDDDAIPMEHAERLFQSAKCDRKDWILVEDLDHNGSIPAESRAEIATTLREFTSLP